MFAARLLCLTALLLPTLAGATGCQSRARVRAINAMNEGVKAERNNNTAQAEAQMKQAVELDPTYGKAYYELGKLYLKQGKLVDAEKAFRGATEHMGEEKNADYSYQLGQVIMQEADKPETTAAARESKYAEARAALEEAIKLNPGHHQAYYRIGKAHERLDEPVAADAAYRKAIEIRPDFSPAFVALGNMYIDYGHANVGQAVLETGTKVNEKDAHMWNGLGRAQLALNKPQDAVEAFTRAKVLDPSMIDVLYGLGKAYAELRQPKEAIENLQAFLQRAGNAPEDIKRDANNTLGRMHSVAL